MNTDPQQIHYEALKALKPSMRYDGSESFIEWQKKARNKLVELVGLDLIEPAKDDKFTVSETVEHDTFTEYTITFQSEEGYFVPCSLWRPKATEEKLPLVICLQGHSTGKHISLGRPKFNGDDKTISGGDRDFARQIVKEGYIALAIEQRCFGECGGTAEGPGCTIPALTALLYGRTTVAERVFDVKRAIDVVLKNFDFIDEAKIACMGNSGGGTATIYSAALDERISVAMPSCALCTYKDSIGAMLHCNCNYVPNIAKYFDMGDLGGLIAPRKIVVVSGAEDPIFPHNGVEESVDILSEYYSLADADENHAWVIGTGGHRFYADISWPVFERMIK